MKPAPCIPQSSIFMEEVFRISGFNKYEFQVAFSSTEDVEKILIPDKRIKTVIFTGSTKAGAAVASVAGKHLKKSMLELGGSDPFIVLPDADLDKVVYLIY